MPVSATGDGALAASADAARAARPTGALVSSTADDSGVASTPASATNTGAAVSSSVDSASVRRRGQSRETHRGGSLLVRRLLGLSVDAGVREQRRRCAGRPPTDAARAARPTGGLVSSASAAGESGACGSCSTGDGAELGAGGAGWASRTCTASTDIASRSSAEPATTGSGASAGSVTPPGAGAPDVASTAAASAACPPEAAVGLVTGVTAVAGWMGGAARADVHVGGTQMSERPCGPEPLEDGASPVPVPASVGVAWGSAESSATCAAAAGKAGEIGLWARGSAGAAGGPGASATGTAAAGSTAGGAWGSSTGPFALAEVAGPAGGAADAAGAAGAPRRDGRIPGSRRCRAPAPSSRSRARVFGST